LEGSNPDIARQIESELVQVVDSTVQPKAVAHPTGVRPRHRVITKLVGLAKRNRVSLRQSYLRQALRAAIMVGRYTRAHQFKRARRQLKFLRTRPRKEKISRAQRSRLCSRKTTFLVVSMPNLS
jgi:hypothetical protein